VTTTTPEHTVTNWGMRCPIVTGQRRQDLNFTMYNGGQDLAFVASLASQGTELWDLVSLKYLFRGSVNYDAA
jgi:hypothetical protein